MYCQQTAMTAEDANEPLSIDSILEQTLKDIGIPPRPEIIDRIAAEMRKEDPNFHHLGQRIGADVSLSASLVKTANSLFFGFRSRAHSTNEALMMPGLDVVSRANDDAKQVFTQWNNRDYRNSRPITPWSATCWLRTGGCPRKFASPSDIITSFQLSTLASPDYPRPAAIRSQRAKRPSTSSRSPQGAATHANGQSLALLPAPAGSHGRRTTCHLPGRHRGSQHRRIVNLYIARAFTRVLV